MRMRFALLVAALVAFAACNNSPTTPTTTPTPSSTTTAVSIVSGASTLTTQAYSPNPVTVSVGTTVIWTNHDQTAHTVTATNGTWDSGPVAPSAGFSRTFNATGTFQYHCTIHPNMVGTVTVQ